MKFIISEHRLDKLIYPFINEYFNETQITPPTKVYIGDKEITRPK